MSRTMSGIPESEGGDVFLDGDNAFTGTNTFNINRPTSTINTTPSSTEFLTKQNADALYGTGSGDVLAAGNNAFTGTNTFNVNRPSSTLTGTPASTDFITKQNADALYGTGDGDVLAAGNNAFTGTNTFNVNRPSSTLTGTPSSTDFITKQDADTLYNTQITTNTNDIATNTSDITTNANNISTLDGEAVKLTGNQTIAGIKTFSSLPECSTAPTTANQLANKTYVDSQAGSIPSNMVTTDTTQTIDGEKTFDNLNTYFNYRIIQDDGTTDNYISQSGSQTSFRQSGSSSYIQQSGQYNYIQQTQTSNKIITAGDIGIGTTSPDAPLHIIKEATFTSGGYNFPAVSIALKRDTARPVLMLGTTDGDTPYIADGDGASVNTAGFLIKERQYDRMYFTRGGGIKISTNFGSTAPNGGYSTFMWGNGGHHIDSYNSTGRNNTGSGRVMYINWYANQGVFLKRTFYSSDDRIKEDEQFITNATETLLKLRPQTYNKYAPEISGNTIRPNYDLSGHYESGLIAQEIYYDAPELRHLVEISDMSGDKVIPSSTDPSTDPDYSDWGNMEAGVNYVELIPYLIKSNQELHERIQQLEQQLNISS